jgi:hypothetical protein
METSMKTKKPSPIEEFLSLSDAEKDAEVARVVALPRSAWRPMTAAQRKRWDKSVREAKSLRLGRPTVGAVAKQISVSMELDRLSRVDRYAEARDLKRTEVIAKAVDLLMSRAG